MFIFKWKLTIISSIIYFTLTSCFTNPRIDGSINQILYLKDSITLSHSHSGITANFSIDLPFQLEVDNIKSTPQRDNILPGVFLYTYKSKDSTFILVQLDIMVPHDDKDRFHSQVHHQMQEYNEDYIALFDSFPAHKHEIGDGIHHKKRLWLYKDEQNFELHLYHSIYFDHEDIGIRLNATIQDKNKLSYIHKVDNIMSKIAHSVKLIDILTLDEIKDSSLLKQFKYYN